MKRKLFCEISPLTYKMSTWKCRQIRNLKNLRDRKKIASEFSKEKLPVVICKQKSLMRRKLGNVDLQLQENKVVNLSLAAPKVSGILIKPGEIFSFWKLVGNCRAKDGYQVGLTIANGQTGQAVGGGMCQFTNLIHWLVLHTPLTIVEHHHHDGMDLFPDYGRQIPFGTGTSILYNYLDYRFQNNTDQTYQLIVYTDSQYLCGELRAEHSLPVKYHIKAEGERFVQEGNEVYREGKIYQEIYDVVTGKLIEKNLIKENHAKLMYEIDPQKITEKRN